MADDEARRRPVSFESPLDADPNEDAGSAYRPLAVVAPRRKRPVYSHRCESDVEATSQVVRSSSYASGGGGAAVVVMSSTAARGFLTRVVNRSLVGSLYRCLTGACALCGVLIGALRAGCLGLLARRKRRGAECPARANICASFFDVDRWLSRLDGVRIVAAVAPDPRRISMRG